MQQLLEQPVEYGDVRLAPTTELAEVRDDQVRLATLCRIAGTIRAEDEARAERTRLRALADQDALPTLPRRR